jgi:hypothetical protein
VRNITQRGGAAQRTANTGTESAHFEVGGESVTNVAELGEGFQYL